MIGTLHSNTASFGDGTDDNSFHGRGQRCLVDAGPDRRWEPCPPLLLHSSCSTSATPCHRTLMQPPTDMQIPRLPHRSRIMTGIHAHGHASSLVFEARSPKADEFSSVSSGIASTCCESRMQMQGKVRGYPYTSVASSYSTSDPF